MTAINLLLDRTTHPQRKPYVRETTFIDGIGPPPWTWFDETQDHLAGLFHQATGWNCSNDRDEFVETAQRPGYFGRMLITRQYGTLSTGPTVPDSSGEHGVWVLASDGEAWNWTMQGSWLSLDGDFLLTCKIKPMFVEQFDDGGGGGLVVSVGPRFRMPQALGFAAGGDRDVWQIMYAQDDHGVTSFADTDVPLVSGRWYRLQVSRVAGAVRWFINGQLCRLNQAEGLYYPFRILDAAKFLEAARTNVGSVGAGFLIDCFHLRAERSVA